MPLLFIFFIILVVRALTLDGAMEGVVKFFLAPDFSNITGKSLLYALGQSLLLACSRLFLYGDIQLLFKERCESDFFCRFCRWNEHFVSLLAGLAIFRFVFAFGYEPAEGPGLLFIVLPSVFAQMPFGELFLSLFLILFYLPH